LNGVKLVPRTSNPEFCMTNDEETSDGSLPPPEAIAAQLDTILNSKTFSGSTRSKLFLAFVVRQSMQGRGTELKEVVIGTEVFGQSGFDPKRNSSVRSAANRLRLKLTTYYADEGKTDAVIITLPEGAYVPRFTLKPVPILDDPAPSIRASNEHLPALSTGTRSPNRVLLWIAVVGGLAILAGLGAFGFRFLLRSRVTVSENRVPTQPLGRLFALATSEGNSPKRLDLGYEIGWLLVTPDSKVLYAIELYGRGVTALGVDDLQVKLRFQLPHAARGAVISRDGKHIYIGSPDAVIMIVDAKRGKVERSLSIRRPVFDLAVTPDETKIFLAMGSDGLERLLTVSGEAATLSVFACPLSLRIDSEGKRLFVSYQCGGPGGRDGHDVMEIYDTATEERIGVIRDLPMVGGPPVVSPNGDFILLDALDACLTEKYDHLGCPPLPGHVFHLVRTSDSSVVKSFSRPRGTYGAAFSPDGGRLVFGGDRLVVMDWAREMVTEIAPVRGKAHSIFASTPTGSHTFVASFQVDRDLLVFDTEERRCGSSPDRLANQYSGDGTFDDSVGVSALTAIGTVKFAPGIIGQAFQFNGMGAHLEGGGGAGCWPCEGNWTESFFTKFDSIDGEMTLLEREGPSDRWRHRVFKAKDNRILLRAGDPATGPLIIASAPAQPNTWYHVVIVADGARRSFYINGISQGHVDLPGPYAEPMNRGVVTIGASRRNRAAFNGLIDEITWHERALDAEEVMNIANARDRNNCSH
jgi:WD40 repeat protein